jgi:hypothetical protein
VSNPKVQLYLVTPFADKDVVKALGARWDPNAKKWFVPNGVDINPFEKWWPKVAGAGSASAGSERTVKLGDGVGNKARSKSQQTGPSGGYMTYSKVPIPPGDGTVPWD